jgi:dihydroxy-acid dehydratase
MISPLPSDGDRILVDANTNTISLLISDEELDERKKQWVKSEKRELPVKRGVLFRYARDVKVS